MGPEENQCCLAWQLPHCCSVPKSCWLFATHDVLNLWCVDITSGSSAFHYLLEFAQIHVHCIGDAIQPSHPLSSPPPPAFNLSQHQGLFQWVSSSYQVAKILELQFQHQSFHWIFRIDSLRTDLLSVQGTLKNLLQHHNLKSSVLQCSTSIWFKAYICTRLLEKPFLWLCRYLLTKWWLCFLICSLGLS